MEICVRALNLWETDHSEEIYAQANSDFRAGNVHWQMIPHQELTLLQMMLERDFGRRNEAGRLTKGPETG